ncbi:MMPL family transporter [Amycolatopsis nalaikhensis]|uniref:MMPL family transporter n=1 Tax=Amycolatopsis nalaikhensis TaxID=715472 RepID=A0ABY8XQJ7_9PSEU|nr:MMPL family transporter [Amycolatopsis sp. 2-2]WIV57906.1 MMPL family transporter [Amycolatopsis sp. 2-2]
MSTLLYRVGRFAYARPWRVLGAWLLLLAVIAVALMVQPVRLTNEIRIDGTPAQETIDQLARSLPAASGGQGMIAFAAEDGQHVDEGANRAAVLAAVDGIYGADHVVDTRRMLAEEVAKGVDSPLMRAAGAIERVRSATAPPPGAPVPLVMDGRPVPGVVVSADRTVALFQFQFDRQTFELPAGTVDRVVGVAEDAVDGARIDVLPSSVMLQVPDVLGVGEIVGVVVAAVVLLLTLGSVVAAGLPLATALLGVGVGVGGAFALSAVFSMHSVTVVLALMLGLAVGIDYALFIVNRQRRLILDQGLTAHEAAGRALGTAGNAVFFAGSTVIIALVGLLVVNIQILTTMALVAAATVAIAVLASLTALPALIGLVGERICSPAARRTAGRRARRHPVAHAWATALTRRPLVGAVAAIAVATVLAVPALAMNLGLPAGSSYDTGTPQRDSYDTVAHAFGDGYNGPLILAATSTDRTALPPERLAGLYRDLSATPGVAAVNLGALNDTGTTALLSVVPATGPTDEATATLVRTLREQAPRLAAADGLTVGVTGFSALGIDVSDRLADVLPTYVAVVLALSLIVLLLVFRSILVPVKATLGFLLSIGAALGATTAVFQWGWVQQALGMDATSPVLSMLPIIVAGVLYGLAMDYEMFLVSSIREATLHNDHGRDAVVHGFEQASRVVVAAAVIMSAVFAGFVFSPEPMIAQIGFALTVGILVDAFVVRMTLVPAIMALFGDRAWWLPRWLARALPNLDIEGDRLYEALRTQSRDRPAAATVITAPGDNRP